MTEELRAYPFQFTGTGSGYFRIWIGDLFLCVATLGIYSAWARVRRRRYFLEHTLLDGHRFEYLADPLAILRRRVPGYALLAAYGLAQWAWSWAALPFLALALLLLPWLVVDTLRFEARHCRYRGTRFAFHGGLGESYRIFLGLGLLVPLSLGWALPYLAYRKTGFVTRHLAYGRTRWDFQAGAGAYSSIYLKAGLIMLLPPVLGLAAGILRLGRSGAGPAGVVAAAGVGLCLVYAALPLAAAYIAARRARLAVIGARIGKLGFAGRHGARALAGLYVANLLRVVLTLGLYLPWARARRARFWLDNLALVAPATGLEDFVAAASASAPGATPPVLAGVAEAAPGESPRFLA